MSALAQQIQEKVEYLKAWEGGMGENPATDVVKKAHDKAMDQIMLHIGGVKDRVYY